LIEERAHRENILLSPEATRILLSVLAKNGQDTESFLTEVFENAKSAYPREDGWILLSKERTDALVQHVASSAPTQPPVTRAETSTSAPGVERPLRVAPHKVSELSNMHHAPVANSVMNSIAQPKAQARPVPEPPAAANGTTDVLASFVGHLVNNEQQKTFDLLRQMTAKGIAPDAFIARVVRELDEIYKHRLEGNHKPNAALASVTATWSNADFETVLGMLVECIDYSYTSTRIGTKVALAKAFEHFASR
jgi:hypothetical protein